MVALESPRSEEHTSELQSQSNLVCRLLLEKKNTPNAFRLFGDHPHGHAVVLQHQAEDFNRGFKLLRHDLTATRPAQVYDLAQIAASRNDVDGWTELAGHRDRPTGSNWVGNRQHQGARVLDAGSSEHLRW